MNATSPSRWTLTPIQAPLAPMMASFLAICGLVSACSQNTSTGTSGTTGNGTVQGEIVCIDTSSKYDCGAEVAIRDQDGKNIVNKSTYSLAISSSVTAATNDYEFSIVNAINKDTAAELIIDSIALTYSPSSPAEDASTGDVALQCWDSTGTERCDAHKWRAVVPSGLENGSSRVSVEKFKIRFKQFDGNDRKAKISIKFRNDAKLNSTAGGVYTINLATALGKPEISVDPSDVNWGFVAPNGPGQKQTFTILNKGQSPLIIKTILFTSSTPVFTIDDFGGLQNIPASGDKITLVDPVTVDVGSSKTVSVTATPTDDKIKTATIKLLSNDPKAPTGTDVNLRVNAEVPCLKLNPASKNFGGVLAAGGSDEQTIDVTSCGGTKLCVGSIAFTDNSGAPGEYELDFSPMTAACPAINAGTGPTADNPCCLDVNGKTSFKVKYAPSDISPLTDPANPASDPIPDTATVTVTSNAYQAQTVTLSGSGVKQTCPIVKIDIAEGDEVIPQTELHLKGDGSKGMGGAAIKTYKWTAKQPAGSNKAFSPSSNFPNPKFTPDASGEYEFCLEVTDANGVKSCGLNCKKVLVIPNNAVHVELLWDTPGDPDQTDVGPAAGADLDLHFANYLAFGPDIDCDGTGDPWFNTPFDCFWNLPDPQWGSSNGAIHDDPTLDLDDTDGAGPENLNLEQPEGTPALKRYYSIGVHYWNDHGYNVSAATITVYLLGAVALKIDKINMNPLDMWYVGRLNWPNQLANSGSNDPPLTVCYQSGDTCSGAGKMWQPKGDWCITPCYVNPTFSSTTGGATPPGCKKP